MLFRSLGSTGTAGAALLLCWLLCLGCRSSFGSGFFTFTLGLLLPRLPLGGLYRLCSRLGRRFSLGRSGTSAPSVLPGRLFLVLLVLCVCFQCFNLFRRIVTGVVSEDAWPLVLLGWMGRTPGGGARTNGAKQRVICPDGRSRPGDHGGSNAVYRIYFFSSWGSYSLFSRSVT